VKGPAVNNAARGLRRTAGPPLYPRRLNPAATAYDAWRVIMMPPTIHAYAVSPPARAAPRIVWAAIGLLAAEGVSPGFLAALAPLPLTCAIGYASWWIAAWAGAEEPIGNGQRAPGLPRAANDNRILPRGRQAPSPLAAAIARHYQMQRDRTGSA
jgi:hypothetical protein